MNEARIIADSIGPCGTRITTLLLTYPRMVHADFLRHRVLSHSVGSTRAIPSAKMRARLREQPAHICWWGKNQPGMVAQAALEGQELVRVQKAWEGGLNYALRLSERLEILGLHKQLASRVLEPFGNVVDLVTGTEWENFEALRCHPDAQPEIQDIARRARDARAASTPRRLRAGEWHLPFIVEQDYQNMAKGWDSGLLGDKTPPPAGLGSIDWKTWALLRISVARIARTSYLNHEGVVDYAKDLELFERLVTADPGHWSPLEHVCCAMSKPGWRARLALMLAALVAGKAHGERFRRHGERFLIQSGNMAGFQQLRKLYPNEHIGGNRL